MRYLEYGLLAGVGLQVAHPGGHAAALLGRVETSNGFLQTSENFNRALRYHLLLALSLTRQP